MTRAERVAELIKSEISQLLRVKINDPRIGFTSITRVDVTDDLRNAKVYFSVYENEERKESTMVGLLSAKKYIRAAIAPHLELKFMPELDFKLDNSIERASNVYEIMNKLGSEKPKRKRK